MAHGTRINGTSYGITGGKCLVNGTSYSIKKGRTLIGGTGYDITFGTPLAAYAEGDIVYINENGSPVEFYVAKHDYESGLNGAGRTLVVRKDGYKESEFTDSGNDYAGSTVDTISNSEYKKRIDTNIRELIGTTKIMYTPKGGIDVGVLERSIFVLSLSEYGLSDPYANVEGQELPISSVLRGSVQNGTWTRSRYVSDTLRIWAIQFRGDKYPAQNYINSYTVRPAFTLPSSLIVGSDGVIV